MAVKTINAVKIPLSDTGVPFTTSVLLGTSDTGAFDYTKKDEKIFICIKNMSATAAQTGVIVKGNGLQGVSDLSISFEAAQTRLIALESGKFKQVSGEQKGKVLFKPTDGMFEASAFVMP